MVNGGLRVQVVFPPEVGAVIRALAEAEHRPVRFQVEALIIEALRARECLREVAGDE